MKANKKYKQVLLNDSTLEQVMASDFPRIYIYDMVDKPDETCSITFETNKAFDDLYKKEKKRKRVSKKGLGEFFVEILEKGITKEDGYDIKKLKDV
tara:strand:+ start:313 stop:600 length:288 start_codon:yes stop_codon:yes gene_type:complete